MSLHIIVAYDGPGATARPTVIYCGKCADGARSAIASDTASFRFVRIQNPDGIRKHNDKYAPPVACAPTPTTAAPAPVAAKPKK